MEDPSYGNFYIQDDELYEANFDGGDWEPSAVQTPGEAVAPGQSEIAPGAADLVASSQLISSLQSPQTTRETRISQATAGLQPTRQAGPRTDEQLAMDRKTAFLSGASSMDGINNVRKLLAQEADARGGNVQEWAKEQAFVLSPGVKDLEGYLAQQSGQNGALSAETEAQAREMAAALPAPQNFNAAFDQASGGKDTLSLERYNEFLQGPFAQSLRSNPDNRNDKPAPDNQPIVRKSADGPDQNAMAAIAAMGGNTAEMFNPFSAQVHAAQLAQAPKNSILAKLPLLDPKVVQQANQRPDRMRVNGGYV